MDTCVFDLSSYVTVPFLENQNAALASLVLSVRPLLQEPRPSCWSPISALDKESTCHYSSLRLRPLSQHEKANTGVGSTCDVYCGLPPFRIRKPSGLTSRRGPVADCKLIELQHVLCYRPVPAQTRTACIRRPHALSSRRPQLNTVKSLSNGK